eukprot:2198723-Prymnesium_polylepis.1
MLRDRLAAVRGTDGRVSAANAIFSGSWRFTLCWRTTGLCNYMRCSAAMEVTFANVTLRSSWWLLGSFL